jgi:hypothetical protein
VLNNSSSIISFVLFGVIVLLLLIKAIVSGPWNKKYFTTGLLIFEGQIPVGPRHYDIPSCSRLETHFHSNRTRSLEFHQIASDTVGFREKLPEFRLSLGSYLMYSTLFFDDENSKVVVKGFANWFAVWFSVLWLGSTSIAGMSVRGPASLAITLGPMLLFGLVMGWFYWNQCTLFSYVATIASKAWAGEYSEDTLGPNKRVQSDAAAAARISAQIGLCNVLRIEGHFGKVAARLTRRALGHLRREEKKNR